MECREFAKWGLAAAVAGGCSAKSPSPPETVYATENGGSTAFGEDATSSGPPGETSTNNTADASSFGADGSSESTGSGVCDPTSRLDVHFADTGADPRFTSLDVLIHEDTVGQPIVIWVHGGGWVAGDKSSHEMNPDFASWFANRGEILVPINYRLVDDPAGTTYVEQAEDVAAAIAWVVEHAEEFCGDPDRIHLIGYSAGAHLVALVATDPRYLGAHGFLPQQLRTVISLDVNAYDIPWSIDNAVANDYPTAIVNLPAIFGDDLESQRVASPITHIQTAAVPPSLVISAPNQNGVIQSLSRACSERYVDALNDANNEAIAFDAANDSHASLALDFGVHGDEVTSVVEAFLDAH